MEERGVLDQEVDGVPAVLDDVAPRSPYKRHEEGSRRLARIFVRAADGELHDLAEVSPAVNSLADFSAYRLYARGDSELKLVTDAIEEASR